jgi:hypothetical protein
MINYTVRGLFAQIGRHLLVCNTEEGRTAHCPASGVGSMAASASLRPALRDNKDYTS